MAGTTNRLTNTALGKTTFCQALQTSSHELPEFAAGLVPVSAWDPSTVKAWIQKRTYLNQEVWNTDEAKLLTGGMLDCCFSVGSTGHTEPNRSVLAALGVSNPIHQVVLSRDVHRLVKNGYDSTVGVREAGAVVLTEPGSPERRCSLVDFAGQMEYFYSHRLLMFSMHSLIVIVEEAPNFLSNSRKKSGWRYWLECLETFMSIKESESLCVQLALSKLDLVPSEDRVLLDNRTERERSDLSQMFDVTLLPTLQLDYKPATVAASMLQTRQLLNCALNRDDWSVPSVYQNFLNLLVYFAMNLKAKNKYPYWIVLLCCRK